MQKYSVHLQGQNFVLFDPGEKEFATKSISDLERYFQRPSNPASAT